MTIELESLSIRLGRATIGSCQCLTKTNEYAAHKPDCLYRVLVEAQLEVDEGNAASELCDRLDGLLRATVNTLRGDPPPLVHWSHHDIPELAKLYRAVYGAAVQLIAISGWQGEAGTPAYKAFDALVKAADVLSAEIKRDFDSVRTALKEGAQE